MEKKALINVVIKPAAIELLKKVNNPDRTATSIIAIAEGNYSFETSTDPIEVAAFATIKADTENSYNNKVKAGIASVQKRDSSGSTKTQIEVPYIENSVRLSSKIYGTHSVSPEILLKIRYIMLCRGYNYDEIQIFLNYYLRKMETMNLPVANYAELLDKAQSWDNHRRKLRFEGCITFPEVIREVMKVVSPQQRAYFLDNALKISHNGSGRYTIDAMPEAIEAFKANESIMRRTIKGIESIEYRSHKEFF